MDKNVVRFPSKGFDLESVANEAVSKAGAHGEVSRCRYCGVLFINSPPKLSESCNSASCFLKDINDGSPDFFAPEEREAILKL